MLKCWSNNYAVQVSTDVGTSSSSSWTDMNGMSLNITTTKANSKVLITFSTSIAVGGNSGANFRLLTDGNTRHQVVGKGNDGGNSHVPVSIQYIETFTTAGDYNIKIQWQTVGDWANTIGSGWTRVLNAIEL